MTSDRNWIFRAGPPSRLTKETHRFQSTVFAWGRQPSEDGQITFVVNVKGRLDTFSPSCAHFSFFFYTDGTMPNMHLVQCFIKTPTRPMLPPKLGEKREERVYRVTQNKDYILRQSPYYCVHSGHTVHISLTFWRDQTLFANVVHVDAGGG